MTRRYDAAYREHLKLGDDEVVLSVLRAEDRDLLKEGFERTSPLTRYRRFFMPKRALGERELRFLTEIDGENHLALAVGRRTSEGHVEGVAVARFVRLPEDPRAAEPAILVIDAWQGRGLGRALLVRLVAAARERDIHAFACTVVAGNAPMLHLLNEYPGARFRAEGGEIRVLLDLDAPAMPVAA